MRSSRVIHIIMAMALMIAVGMGTILFPADTFAARNPKLNSSEITITSGMSYKLKVKNALGAKIKWTSSDKKIARVSGTGKVKGYNDGEAVITATVSQGSSKKKLSCVVQVKTPSIAESSYNKTKGDIFTIPITDDYADAKYKWMSSDSSVVYVDGNGETYCPLHVQERSC